MGKMAVTQSVWLAIVVVLFSGVFVGSFVYAVAIVLGFIPLLYLKKYSKKEMLKINLWSGLAALVVLLIVFRALKLLFPAVSTGESVLVILNSDKFLQYGLSFLVLFNVVSLVYYFFGKKKAKVSVEAAVESAVVSVE